MPNTRISMRKIKEVLRLHWECKQSGRAIARSLSVSPNTISDYLARARVANLKWPLPDDLDDEALERLLFPPPQEAGPTRTPPDWAYIHKELHRPGVTLQLLWEEYKTNQPDGYQYSQFCEHYRRYSKHLDVSMRQTHKAGDKLFVDYAGPTVPVTDRHTGETFGAQIFVAVLGASNYTYAEATPSQELEFWIGAHVRALEFFGGVPMAIVPDNLKSGVTKACRYEPDLNPTYHDFSRHYGTAIIPARARKPKDKAKVEAGVLLVERWILAALRNRTFFSLAELNAEIQHLLTRLNDKPFKKLEGCRRSLFLSVEKSVLRPLPSTRYELAEWKKCRVGVDYHVEIARHYYSVPYQLAQQVVEVRVTASVVEILHRGKRVASHPRSREQGRHTTIPQHMPPDHQRYLEWTPERILSWARKKGPQVEQMATAIMDSRDHPVQGIRSCLGILRLEKAYGADRLNAACRRALHFGSRSYKSVEAILKNGLDGRPLPVTTTAEPPLTHDNIRGAGYYTEENEHVESSDAREAAGAEAAGHGEGAARAVGEPDRGGHELRGAAGAVG